MRSASQLWLAFALVLSVLLAALGWTSIEAVRLSRAEMQARHQANVDENLRLALWRMDSALSPLMAQESAHPDYQELAAQQNPTGVSARRPMSTVDRSRGTKSEPLYVAARFQFIFEDGQYSTAESNHSLRPSIASRVPMRALAAQLQRTGSQHTSDDSTNAPESLPLLAEVPLQMNATGIPEKSLQSMDFAQRNQSLIVSNAFVSRMQIQQSDSRETPLPPLHPVWVDGEMLLARRIHLGDQSHIQGALVEWSAMQRWLLGMVEDLLPQARLQPLTDFDAAGESGLLAALPVRLIPGDISSDAHEPSSTLVRMLGVAWGAVLLAAVVGAMLVHGVVRLSRRREAFVSAVTHELRTPLTTFRMYTEMLAQGMVPDADAQQEYLRTLRDESLRLNHMVENVLAYARLERGRQEMPAQVISLAELLGPVLPRLDQQATAGGMELEVAESDLNATIVRAMPSAVEQILINLVDNACKYAHAAEDRRICIGASRRGRFAELRVRDRGPGIPRRRHLMSAFGKSVQEAAHTGPGIGLGLALSQRLAKQMGGNLRVDRTVSNGAAIVLRLPLV